MKKKIVITMLVVLGLILSLISAYIYKNKMNKQNFDGYAWGKERIKEMKVFFNENKDFLDSSAIYISDSVGLAKPMESTEYTDDEDYEYINFEDYEGTNTIEFVKGFDDIITEYRSILPADKEEIVSYNPIYVINGDDGCISIVFRYDHYIELNETKPGELSSGVSGDAEILYTERKYVAGEYQFVEKISDNWYLCTKWTGLV